MKAAILISTRDNVATALEALEAGRVLELETARVTVAESIPRGHKVALRPIREGAEVIKYGSAIGTATADIASGAHVHTHNVASDRGRGDRPADPRVVAPRLAEPPEEMT
jgi:altronate dehydratase